MFYQHLVLEYDKFVIGFAHIKIRIRGELAAHKSEKVLS